MFDSDKLSTDPIQRIRLMVGDITEFPLLEDSVYEYLYYVNDTNEVKTAIEALNNIITALVTNPADERIGSIDVKTSTLQMLTDNLRRLEDKEYEDKQGVKRIPMKVSKATAWTGLDLLYGDKNVR